MTHCHGSTCGQTTDICTPVLGAPVSTILLPMHSYKVSKARKVQIVTFSAFGDSQHKSLGTKNPMALSGRSLTFLAGDRFLGPLASSARRALWGSFGEVGKAQSANRCLSALGAFAPFLPILHLVFANEA